MEREKNHNSLIHSNKKTKTWHCFQWKMDKKPWFITNNLILFFVCLFVGLKFSAKMASFNCFVLALLIAFSFPGGEAARHLLQLPPLPSVPNLPKPTLPPMPSIPALPQPTLPTLPTTQPSLPKPTLPPLPSLPTTPSLPKVTLPPLPSMPSIPTIPIPTTIPSIPFLSPPPAGN
ncbi:hypothetical protein POTOM_028691 [Populus tomentosa]|uniref:Hydroxyproline-rich glycoprotein family protein n=1 Tax=Populus tomentosa TaxID=118781 RepID=A0A8X7ZEB8_POPTO|nr:hypothetical protein POTOM_028691 [Populus tomentosa]